MATDAKDTTTGGFSPSRLRSSELIGVIGSFVLAGSLFLNWFSTDCSAPGTPSGCNGTGGAKFEGALGSFTAFQTFKILDWLLLAACIAPIILAYIVTRGHELSWHPGEVTMIVGMIALSLIVLNGIVLGKPGDVVDMHFEIGYWLGMLGAVLILAGGLFRQAQTARVRKPPGVL
jgi:hypothetical protein